MPSSRAPIGTLVPGTISPAREVPREIARPEYVGKGRAAGFTGSEVKNPETIRRIRVAARLAAQALEAVGRAVVPGVTTDELDRIGHEFLVDRGAYPSTLGYPGQGHASPFPKSLCTSVNEVICHGIPDSTVLRDGDIVNIDITAFIDGVHGDTNATFAVGQVNEAAGLLIKRTREALARAITAVQPGRAVNVIGRVIESYAKRFEYGVVREYTGHGVGEAFHSGLVIPHYDAAPNYATLMETGMVFTIEPMLTLGTEVWELWDDGWTVVTADRSLTAQFEHTLLVAEHGAEILTLP
jgi:methionyl aminopeptidase